MELPWPCSKHAKPLKGLRKEFPALKSQCSPDGWFVVNDRTDGIRQSMVLGLLCMSEYSSAHRWSVTGNPYSAMVCRFEQFQFSGFSSMVQLGLASPMFTIETLVSR